MNVISIVCIAGIILLCLTACSTRRDDGMGDLWKVVKYEQERR